MDRGVRRVDELPWDKGVGDLLGKLLGLGDGALHALGAFGKHQLRAVGFHQLSAFDAHGLGHNNDNAVAAGRRNGSKADAGVAGGGLDKYRARLQQALRLRVVNHGLGDAVLDGTRGVKILQFREKCSLQAFFLLNIGELQQRSLSDQLIGGCIDVRHGIFLLNNKEYEKEYVDSQERSTSSENTAIHTAHPNTH